ncbi:hypothetical protein EPI10_022789 [Gossypium australe]|uniref:Uncharacterized protein n=1 Tax=Gossypium australe TaxID=47621 RepID=A0A5B6VSA9_9ROSI|nr:hypothetical protein EPI10_022789 [Gossypium australe]
MITHIGKPFPLRALLFIGRIECCRFGRKRYAKRMLSWSFLLIKHGISLINRSFKNHSSPSETEITTVEKVEREENDVHWGFTKLESMAVSNMHVACIFATIKLNCSQRREPFYLLSACELPNLVATLFPTYI